MKKKKQIIVDVEALDTLLNQRFLSYTDLSELSGISYNTINRIKRTQRSSMRTVRVLADALKVSPAAFVKVKNASTF